MKNIQFVRFSTIKRAERPVIKALLLEGLGSTPCLIQEKIHGANFSLWTNGHQVRAAKRGGFLKPGADFFGFQAILDRYTPAMKALFAHQQAQAPGLRHLAVFGELYGGLYPHPDVAAAPVKPVQRGIYYRPDLAFCGFDVLHNGRDWLPVQPAMALLAAHGIPAVETLHVGPLAECVHFPVEVAPRLPAQLGLPPLVGNISEGVIIRSLAPLPGRGRLVLKKKSSAWQESDPKQARKRRKQTRKFSPQAQAVLQAALPLICTNRLRNVLSRHGAVRPDEERRLSRALYRDAFDEVVGLEGLSRQERHRVDLVLRAAADELVAEHFFAMLSGAL